ncbi:hypothetical protein [Parasutterella sp.]|jgi:hypothetical protein|uniref:hypothetical protein n=1 Tax=Parasutterella sp. TaxID=2049037 RepID=UPI003994D7EF
MNNEISNLVNQGTLATLIDALSPEQKQEIAKFTVQKQLEIDAELRLAQQSGLLHQNEVNAAISGTAAAAEAANQYGVRTNFSQTIKSTDGRIVTTITSKKSFFG